MPAAVPLTGHVYNTITIKVISCLFFKYCNPEQFWLLNVFISSTYKAGSPNRLIQGRCARIVILSLRLLAKEKKFQIVIEGIFVSIWYISPLYLCFILKVGAFLFILPWLTSLFFFCSKAARLLDVETVMKEIPTRIRRQIIPKCVFAHKKHWVQVGAYYRIKI